MSFASRFLRRPSTLALTLLSLLAVPVAAHATPVYYTVSLSGGFTGTLTLELSSAVGAASATYTKTGTNQLLAMTYTINGTADGTETFDLAEDPSAEFIYFGNPWDFVDDYAYTFESSALTDGNRYEVASTNADDFDFDYGQNATKQALETYGPLTLSSPPVTPEPSSLILLGTGILSMGGLVRRRLAKRTS